MKVCVCRVSSLFMLGWGGREREKNERERIVSRSEWNVIFWSDEDL
jgi:hypothetical protein